MAPSKGEGIEPWLLRALLAGASGAVGALLGRQVLQGPNGWLAGLGLAVAVAATALLLADHWRTQRLLRWMAGDQSGPAPRGPGPLGDLGYRIERALQARDNRATTEQQRLAQFLSAIEASPNGVMLLDAHDRIQWFNQRAAVHFGLDPLRDREQRVTNLVRAPVFVAHLQAGRYDDEVCFPDPGGQATLSVTVRRYGEAMKLVLSQDITERERTDTMRRDFVANVSHEIRSPLTVLSGFVETLATLPLTEAERKRVLDLMRQQAQRMQHLVTDLLALARIEGAPRPEADRWVGVDTLMEHVHSDALASDAQQHRIETVVGTPAQVSGSESELFSAVWNLASNALRYTPAGGSVTIAWGLRGDGSGEFCVTDTGVGIAREHIPRLTERFYRVDGSRSRATGGTGLGLAIVKHVVQRHDGELQIHSTPGKGSQFRFVLPAHRVRVAAAPAAAHTPPAAHQQASA
jgi:two-component system phosphate regulon sensor histidine kinase PhoR